MRSIAANPPSSWQDGLDKGSLLTRVEYEAPRVIATSAPPRADAHLFGAVVGNVSDPRFWIAIHPAGLCSIGSTGPQMWKSLSKTSSIL